MRAATPLLLLALLSPLAVNAVHGPQPPLPTTEILVGDVPLTVEVADESREREHGLMFRDALADGHGMLFVYPAERRRVFWMRHTAHPLDAGFVTADGRLDEVVPLEPYSERPVASRRPARYVIEVPQGWFARHRLEPGTRVSGLP